MSLTQACFATFYGLTQTKMCRASGQDFLTRVMPWLPYSLLNALFRISNCVSTSLQGGGITTAGSPTRSAPTLLGNFWMNTTWTLFAVLTRCSLSFRAHFARMTANSVLIGANSILVQTVLRSAPNVVGPAFL